MRSILKACSLALTLVVLTASFGGPALAAPRNSSTGSGTIVTSGQETITLSPAACARIKAAYPTHAKDPKVCQFTHGWTETRTPGVAGAVVAATSCPTGTASYHDWVNWESLYIWEEDLDTSWQWNGFCERPTMESQSCYFRYMIDTTLNSQHCYNYVYNESKTTSWAAVYTANLTINFAGQTDTTWQSQRRECYNPSVGDCNWTEWVGP